MRIGTNTYRSVVVIDSEFGTTPDGHQDVRCIVAHDVDSATTRRVWLDGATGSDGWSALALPRDALIVAFFAIAEAASFLSLGWQLPERVIDLYAEFCVSTNGAPLTAGKSLVGALAHYGLTTLDVAHKEEMRKLALRGGEYSEIERDRLLAYCESDVLATVALLRRMAPSIDTERAELRGRYMVALAQVERVGVPVDAALLRAIRDGRADIATSLVKSVEDMGVFDRTRFVEARWSSWCAANGVSWPRTAQGRPVLNKETFAALANAHPGVSRIRQVRHLLGHIHDIKLDAGSDGRLRCMTSPFRTTTGRNMPSPSYFIFGMPSWMRGLVRPLPGRALAYVDWSAQEFGIAGALSKDAAMIAAYHHGDPYIAFGRAAGLLPKDATRETHAKERSALKVVVLAAQYGLGVDGLAARLRISCGRAADLLRRYRYTYSDFTAWSERVVEHALLHGNLVATFGWRLRLPQDPNDRSLRNFPIQANASEMMRLATIFAVERGVSICAIVHDAFLIEAPADSVHDAITTMREAMANASELVLAGLRLRSDAQIVRDHESMLDSRGRPTWEVVMAALGRSG